MGVHLARSAMKAGRLCAALAAATLLGVAVAVSPNGQEEFNFETPGYNDGFYEKEFDSLSRKQLSEAAKKMATSFGICSLTGKRLRQSCKLTKEKKAGTSLGEGMDIQESTWAKVVSHAARVEEATQRGGPDGNGVAEGATKLDKMAHSELIHFCKKTA